VIWNCAASTESRPHEHEFDEYILIVSGSCTINMGGKTIELSPGDEHLIPRGIRHSVRCNAGTRAIDAFAGPRAVRAKSTIDEDEEHHL